MQTKSNRSIYIVSFFEGAAVMATELCGSKLIAPYFGSSLYVWAAVIAITLGSLAAGYFYGGKLSEKNDRVKKLSLVLLIAALYMGAMPFIANLFGPIALRFGLLFSVT
ncbi:MAG TPA: fused MFS/spermidine synthase, partial [Bacteroidia bacterium]|nr:fused MFS/spermidine synthase [Bacteroidia bacterium]